MKTAEQRLAWALGICEKAQLRVTPVRRAILAFLAERQLPATLEMVTQADGVRDLCNATTLFRTLHLFKEADIARLVGTPHKTSYFMLNTPGEESHFLICRRCGEIVAFSLPDKIMEQINQLVRQCGFAATGQDCEIYGFCQNCYTARQREVIPSKLNA